MSVNSNTDGIYPNLIQSVIKEAVQNLLTEDGYKKAKEKVRDFNFVHTWDDIAKEFTNYF